MNLELFNNLLKNTKENKIVQEFIKEISNYLGRNNMNEEILKQDNGLYQVVDIASDGVYLQNTENNKVSLEKDISKDMLSKISNDYILRYKNEEYIFEEELTDKFFNTMIGRQEYQEIQEKFLSENNMKEVDENTQFFVKNIENEYTILEYENGDLNVPNVLLPFFIDNNSIVYYRNGKFEK